MLRLRYPPSAPIGDVYPYLLEFMWRLGDQLQKGERRGVDVLADGRARIVVEYPTLGDLLTVLEQLDALKAMASEHGSGARVAAASPASSRPRMRRGAA